MATATTPHKFLLAAVGAVLGSALAVGGFAALAGPAEASAAQPISAGSPLGVKQGVASAGQPSLDVPVESPLGTAPVGVASPAGLSGSSGSSDGRTGHEMPGEPYQGVDPVGQPGPDMPITPGPGDPLYDPPIVITDPAPPMPGDPLYDPPIHVAPEPVVRDHRDDAPGWGAPSGANAPGGVTVTPTDGSGPIIRDHRGGK